MSSTATIDIKDDSKYYNSSSKLEMYCETPMARPSPAPSTSCRFHSWFCGSLVLLMMNLVLMYLVHFTHNHDDVYASKVEVLETLSQQLPESAAPGQLLSFDSRSSHGLLQSGAGTSVYLNISKNTDVVGGMQNLILSSFDATSVPLMVYRNPHDQSCVLSRVSLSSSFLSEFQHSSIIDSSNCQPQDFISLSKDVAMVLTWSSTTGTTAIVPILTTESLSVLSKVIVTTRSVATRMAKLSSKRLITCFYAYADDVNPNDVENFDWTQDREQHVTVHEFNTITGQHIQTSTPLRFGPTTSETYQTHFSSPVAIPGRENTFAIVYYQSRNPYTVKSEDKPKNFGLCLDVFHVHENVVSRVVSRACHRGSEPYYHMDVTSSDAGHVIVAYYDGANNYAMTLLTIELTANDQVYFRSHVVVNSRSTGRFDFGHGLGFFPAPKLAWLKPDTLACSYLEAGARRPTLRTFTRIQSSLVETLSSVPLTQSDFQIETLAEDSVSPVVTLALLACSNHRLLSAVSGQVHGREAHEFALVQVLPRAVGTVMKNHQVALSGIVDMTHWMTLEPGYVYYCTTKGQVVKGHPYRGHDDQTLIALQDDLYVSRESEIGLAISDHELVLTKN